MVVRGGSRRNIRGLHISLAKYLVRLKEGQRLPSIRELAAVTQMSFGSISAALKQLQEMGAVKIQNHGHLGAMLVELSLPKLWELLEQGPLVIALTLPMHSRFEGLATGIKRSLEKAGIETYLIFIRGSHTRLTALQDDRCHAIALSGLAAEQHCGKDHDIILQLPPGSWVSGYCVYYRTLTPPAGKPLRVAVDMESFDHKHLSQLEFAGQPVEYRPGSYVQISRLLKNGEVDATVWTTDQGEAFQSPGIQFRPLSERVMAQAGLKSTSATLVAKADHPLVRELFHRSIQPEEVIEIQRQVVSGEIIPEY